MSLETVNKELKLTFDSIFSLDHILFVWFDSKNSQMITILMKFQKSYNLLFFASCMSDIQIWNKTVFWDTL